MILFLFYFLLTGEEKHTNAIVALEYTTYT